MYRCGANCAPTFIEAAASTDEESHALLQTVIARFPSTVWPARAAIDTTSAGRNAAARQGRRCAPSGRCGDRMRLSVEEGRLCAAWRLDRQIRALRAGLGSHVVISEGASEFPMRSPRVSAWEQLSTRDCSWSITADWRRPRLLQAVDRNPGVLNVRNVAQNERRRPIPADRYRCSGAARARLLPAGRQSTL